MQFNIRTLKKEDYNNILVKWWKDWGWSAPSIDFLPEEGEGGLIVFDGEEPICAGFIYSTNSKVAWVDWIISSKTYRKKPQRKEAIEFLIEKLTHTCESNGFKYIYALIKNDSLIKTYEAKGYTQADAYNKEMIKIL